MSAVDAFDGELELRDDRLPGQFNGKDAIERSWKAHQKDPSVSAGVMIHEVIREVDEGRVVVSEAVGIREGESLEALTERIHEVSDWTCRAQFLRRADRGVVCRLSID